MTNHSNPYILDLPKLSDGRHHLTLTVDDNFMALCSGASPVEHLEVTAALTVDKSAKFIDVRYNLNGFLQLSCDRCLEPFNQPLQATARVIYSFDPQMKDITDGEVVHIKRGTQQLDLSQDLYDFICLEVPYRKSPELDPSHVCNPKVIKHLSEDSQTQPGHYTPFAQLNAAIKPKPQK